MVKSYAEWADEYYCHAERIITVIEALKKEKRKKGLSESDKEELNQKILKYHEIKRDLLDVAKILRSRAMQRGEIEDATR